MTLIVIHVVFTGKNLEDGKPLHVFGIQKHSTVHLVGRVLGGDGISSEFGNGGLL